MSAEPEPSGDRQVPPPYLRTALATGDDKPPRVVLLLEMPVEAHCLAVAFRKLDWRVDVAWTSTELFSLAEEIRTAVVVTDDTEVVDRLRKREVRWSNTGTRSQKMFTILVSDLALKSEGADYILMRPLNRDDPLGFARS